MKRNTPTRIVETGRLVRGSSGQGVGWLQNLAERARNLRAQIVGINDRLTSPLQNGVPGAVTGELKFLADQNQTITIAQYPANPDMNPPDDARYITPLLVNPIVLAGQTYRIPIMFPPPGVFEAHNLVVGVEAGFTMFANQNRPGITPLNDYRQAVNSVGVGGGGGGPGVNGAYRGKGFVSDQPTEEIIQYSWQQQVLGNFAAFKTGRNGSGIAPYLPFAWNIIDEKSGRQYAQDWIPSGCLLNTRGNVADTLNFRNNDSELFEFDTPWIFERDAQVAFLFRPLMDLYQIAAADSQKPYYGGVTGDTTVDDLTGGRRFEEATVRVEFHGNRYYTDQDVLKDGARVTNAYDSTQRDRPERRNP